MHEILKIVTTKQEFINFLEIVIEDCKKITNQIPHYSYLESIQSWVEDMDGYYENTNQQVPNNIDWNFIPTLFWMGNIYE